MERYDPSCKRPLPDTGDALIKGGEGRIQERIRVVVKWLHSLGTFAIWWIILDPATCSNPPTHCQSKAPEAAGDSTVGCQYGLFFREMLLQRTAVMIIAVGTSTPAFLTF